MPSPDPRPRIGVSVGVWRGDEVLIVERSGDPFGRVWSFPGGHLEWGESLDAAARREVMEETGLEIAIAGAPLVHEVILAGDDGATVRHYVLIVFAATAAAGAEPVAASDAVSARFIRPEQIADFPVTPGLADFIARTRATVG